MNNTTAAPHDTLESCLRAVLAYQDQPFDAAALRARVAGGGEAWTEETLIRAADSLGCTVQTVRIERTLPALPAICLTHDGTALAVLALEGDTQVLLVDPLRSEQPVLVALDDLMARLGGKGFCISGYSNADAADGDGAHTADRRDHWFWGPLLRARRFYLQVAAAALLINVFALSGSIFSMIVYDRVIPSNTTDTLVALLAGVSIIFCADFLIRTVRGYFLDLASARADAAIADALFEQILEARIKARRGNTGVLASTLKEFESVRDFLTSATLTTFIDIPFALLFFAIIFLIGGPIAWVPVAALPLMLIAGFAVQPQLRRLIRQAQDDGHQKHSILVETIGGIETIKALGAGPMMRRRWQAAVRHQSNVGLQSRMLAQVASNVANMAQQFVQVAVVAVGALLVQRGELGFGAIIACTILAGRAIAPVAQITQLLTRMNQAVASYRSLAQLMSQEREHRHGASFLSRPHFAGAIEFRDVCFGYGGASRPVLDGVSFQIAPGEKVAVVGKVGSGKTTLAMLILGLYRPDAGAVLIDGIDVRQLDPADLRRALGVVLQDVWLMGGTIRQNIALGGEHADDAEILHAARVAGVEDFVRLQPEGYGLRLGERGEGLSGGQRQAVAIARALLGKPPILLFDEATSAMDAGAEAELWQRLGAEIAGRTLIAITHKPSLLQRMDKIIVLDQGRVTLQGTPAQLLRTPAGQAA